MYARVPYVIFLDQFKKCEHRIIFVVSKIRISVGFSDHISKKLILKKNLKTYPNESELINS